MGRLRQRPRVRSPPRWTGRTNQGGHTGPKVYPWAGSRIGETGGERPHQTGSKFDPFRTTQPRARTFDFPPWLTYPFPNAGG